MIWGLENLISLFLNNLCLYDIIVSTQCFGTIECPVVSAINTEDEHRQVNLDYYLLAIFGMT